MSQAAQQSIDIACTAEHFYKVLTDFAKHKDFVSDLLDVKVLDHSGETYKVKYKIKVLKEIEYELEHSGVPGKSVKWHLIKGQFMKVNQGEWEIQETGPESIHVTYKIELKLSALVPSSVTTQLAQMGLPKMLREFKDYAESTYKGA